MVRVSRKRTEKRERRFRFPLFRSRRGSKRLSQATVGGGATAMTKQRFFDSRLFVIVLIGLVGLLLVSVTRESIRRVQIAREIRIVEEQLARQQDRNAQMALLTNVLNTSVAQEKQSRLTLNSIAPGEKVIIIQSETRSAGPQADQIVLPNGETVDTIEQARLGSNPKKWFDYFFRNL